MTKEMLLPNKSTGYRYISALVLLLLTCLLLGGCKTLRPDKGEGQSGSKNAVTDVITLLKADDTASVRHAMQGQWQLDKICQSTFVGLKCDTTKKMVVKIDAEGGIQWIKDGQGQVKNPLHFNFVKKAGSASGMGNTDSTWVVAMVENEHSYLIQKLQNDSLQMAEYPLIMDKTTTYHLHK